MVRREMGWWLGMVISGFLVLTILFLDIPGCMVGIVMAYYLTRKRAKRWFKLN